MASKRFWLGMLVMVLVFGMTVVGCGDDDGGGAADTWTDVTSMTQLNGTWKGSASQSESQQGLTVTMTWEMTITIVATNDTTGTISGTNKMTQTLSGSGSYFNTAWSQMKQEAEGEEGVTIDESKHSISQTYTISSEPISFSDMNEAMNGAQINQNGKKLKLPASEEDGSPEMIFVKQ